MKNAIVVFSFFVCLHSNAQYFSKDEYNVYHVGPPSSTMNYYSAVQDKQYWCWAASIQMILNYYNVSITQQEIVERLYGKDFNGEAPNNTATDEQINYLLNNWSVDNKGKKYRVKSVWHQGSTNSDDLLDILEDLKKGIPIVLSYKTGPQMGHVVILTGMNYTLDINGDIDIVSIIVRDPWPSPENLKNLGRKTWKAKDLLSKLLSHWHVSVLNANVSIVNKNTSETQNTNNNLPTSSQTTQSKKEPILDKKRANYSDVYIDGNNVKTIRETIDGNVKAEDNSQLYIQGNCKNNVIANDNSIISITGDVHGDVFINDNAKIIVTGKILGKIFKRDNGVLVD